MSSDLGNILSRYRISPSRSSIRLNPYLLYSSTFASYLFRYFGSSCFPHWLILRLLNIISGNYIRIRTCASINVLLEWPGGYTAQWIDELPAQSRQLRHPPAETRVLLVHECPGTGHKINLIIPNVQQHVLRQDPFSRNAINPSLGA